jgi:hypothetical protein
MLQWSLAGVITDDIARESPTEETLKIASHVLIRGAGIGRTRLVVMLRDQLTDKS